MDVIEITTHERLFAIKVITNTTFTFHAVIGAHKEPVPGWIDTFHGPIGLFIGIGKGVIRTAFSCSTTRPDYMPVDIAIKGMIVAAWKKAVKE